MHKVCWNHHAQQHYADYIQEDKFERPAIILLNEEVCSSNSTFAKASSGSIVSLNKKENWGEYWRDELNKHKIWQENLVKEALL